MRTRSRLVAGSLDNYQLELQRWRRTPGPPKGTPTFDGWEIPKATWKALPYNESREITSDENHKLRNLSDLIGRGFLADVGGPFDSQKWGGRSEAIPQTLATDWCTSVYPYVTEYQYRLIGPIFAINPDAIVASPVSVRRSLTGVGTTAIARCKPTNHIADLAVDMVELYQRQIPRLPGVLLWKARTRFLKALGGEYLNIQFGWEPLVSDIHDACRAAANSERLMKAYEENSGKPVRRAYTFPVEESVVLADLGANDGFGGVHQQSFFTPTCGGFLDTTKSQPHLLRTTKFSRRTWFSGSFTYHLPSYYHSRKRLSRIAAAAEHLYGLELTPSTVWQAVPWTWAVDWFSNTGDVISNLSDWSADGLVMHYGYLMEHIVQEVTYGLDRPSRLKKFGGGYAHVSSLTAYYDSKQRIRASPFGFETDWNGLSLRQLAIAAALGVSKFR